MNIQAAKSEPAKQGPYYVGSSVGAIPIAKKYTLAEAIEEAKRLGSFSHNAEKTIIVFQIVATLPPAERRVVMVGEEA